MYHNHLIKDFKENSDIACTQISIEQEFTSTANSNRQMMDNNK